MGRSWIRLNIFTVGRCQLFWNILEEKCLSQCDPPDCSVQVLVVSSQMDISTLSWCTFLDVLLRSELADIYGSRFNSELSSSGGILGTEAQAHQTSHGGMEGEPYTGRFSPLTTTSDKQVFLIIN